MGNVEVPLWLKELPLAPEFHPTETEFADPIAYISKIEKEASAFGICKVVPPLPKPSKKYVLSNLNNSLSKCLDLDVDVKSGSVCSSTQMGLGNKGNDGEGHAVFTTRHQELGYSLKRMKGPTPVRQSVVQKQVWQSGEVYTLDQFESKSKAFARNHLGVVKDICPLTVETLFWRAASEKPLYIEYANDVPGSGFGEPEEPFRYFRKRKRRKKFSQTRRQCLGCEKQGETVEKLRLSEDADDFTVNDMKTSSARATDLSSPSPVFPDEGVRFSRQKILNASSDKEGTAGWKLSNSPWNLQVIARSRGSLTRYMPDEVPGVTSPMVYIGMLFSWFAWHVEDHELHSLNFLHTGSPKTWYAVPGDYAFDLEEVIRRQGYGGHLDRLAALSLLGEKTTLLSPEVVVASGIPCCRLVQNPGEFVVTFPRAYHVGFSHGFNCGEAANFATPQWLKVANEAAIRRAVMNYLPMLSHQQLLYMLTMSFTSRVSRALLPGVRSSRLRDRKKEEREIIVKKAFIDDLVKEDYLLDALLQKQPTFYAVLWDPEMLPSPSNGPFPRSLSTSLGTSGSLVDKSHNDLIQCSPKHERSFGSMKDGFRIEDDIKSNTSSVNVSSMDSQKADEHHVNVDLASAYIEAMDNLYLDDDDLPCGLHVDSGTLTCVACGILGFPFMAIVQPSNQAAMELFPADDKETGGELQYLKFTKPRTPSDLDKRVKDFNPDILLPLHDSSQTPEDPPTSNLNSHEEYHVLESVDNQLYQLNHSSELAKSVYQKDMQIDDTYGINPCDEHGKSGGRMHVDVHSTVEKNSRNMNSASVQPCSTMEGSVSDSHKLNKQWNTSIGFLRPRIFCLEHALEIEQLLECRGGANVLVICHSDYTKIKQEAFAISEDIGIHLNFKDLRLESASQTDLDLINTSIDDEDHEECGEDWTSKLGVNLKYYVKLRTVSPCKQEPYALALGGIFSDQAPGLHVFSLRWHSRKSRTHHKANGLTHCKLHGNVEMKEDVIIGGNSDGEVSTENEVNQHSRSCSSEPSFLAQASTSRSRGRPRKHQSKVLVSSNETTRAADRGELMVSNKVNASGTKLSSSEKEGNYSAKSNDLPIVAVSVPITYEMQESILTTEKTITVIACSSLEYSGISLTTIPMVENSKAHINIQRMELKTSVAQEEIQMTERINMVGETCDSAKSAGLPAISISIAESSEMPQEIQAEEEVRMVCEVSDSSTSAILPVNADPSFERFEPQQEIQSMEESGVMGEMFGTAEFAGLPSAATSLMKHSESHKDIQASEQVFLADKINDSTRSADLATVSVSWIERTDMQQEIHPAEESKVAGEACVSNKLVGKQSSSAVETSKMQQEKLMLAGTSDSTMSSAVPTIAITGCCETLQDIHIAEDTKLTGDVSSQDAEGGSSEPTFVNPNPSTKERKKRKREVEHITDGWHSCNGFIRSPCEGLRPRAMRNELPATGISQIVDKKVTEKPLKRHCEPGSIDISKMVNNKVKQKADSSKTFDENVAKKAIKRSAATGGTKTCKSVDEKMTKNETKRRSGSVGCGNKNKGKGLHRCDIDGCRMTFMTRAELALHKRNRCTHKGCEKRFSSHKYAMHHQRVHVDERPLKCSWKGCKMSFKWAWARTEHMRVHTGERPYQCKVAGCGLTFRFVSDFSRHRRKTGHSVDSTR